MSHFTKRLLKNYNYKVKYNINWPHYTTLHANGHCFTMKTDLVSPKRNKKTNIQKKNKKKRPC